MFLSLANAVDSASTATQFGVFGGVVAVMFYMLTRSDKREKEDRDRSREKAVADHMEMEGIRADLVREREAHAATRVEVAELRVECVALRERCEKCEEDHVETKAALHDLHVKMELLMITPPKKPRSKKSEP